MEVTVAKVREKFSSQLDADVLARARKLAQSEGRQLQSLIEEALVQYLDRSHTSRPREHVMSAFAESLEDFDNLYKHLAK